MQPPNPPGDKHFYSFHRSSHFTQQLTFTLHHLLKHRILSTMLFTFSYCISNLLLLIFSKVIKDSATKGHPHQSLVLILMIIERIELSYHQFIIFLSISQLFLFKTCSRKKGIIIQIKGPHLNICFYKIILRRPCIQILKILNRTSTAHSLSQNTIDQHGTHQRVLWVFYYPLLCIIPRLIQLTSQIEKSCSFLKVLVFDIPFQ